METVPDTQIDLDTIRVKRSSIIGANDSVVSDTRSISLISVSVDGDEVGCTDDELANDLHNSVVVRITEIISDSNSHSITHTVESAKLLRVCGITETDYSSITASTRYVETDVGVSDMDTLTVDEIFSLTKVTPT